MLSRATRGLSAVLIRSTLQAVQGWKGFSKSTKASARALRRPCTHSTTLCTAVSARATAPERWDRKVRDSLEHK